MSTEPQPASPLAGLVDMTLADGTLSVVFGERLTAAEAARLWAELPRAVFDRQPGAVRLDLARVRHLDTSGVVTVVALRDLCAARGLACALVSAPPLIDDALRQVAAQRPAGPRAGEPPRLRRWPVATANAALYLLREARASVAFVGDLTAALAEAARQPGRVRWHDFLVYLQQCGADALPIVLLICLLMGVIMAFQAAVQLHTFGADIFVADLVGLSITRELGPLMVAMICAGRSGAAFAAEIGTMKVGEEVDALVTLGLDPQRFLVVPKVLALLCAMPCLTLLGDLVGVLGGLVISWLVLGLPPSAYARETVQALSYADLFGGLAKSVVFAMLVAGVGCLRGFQTANTAQSVGRSTTAAVVTGIFLIVVADAGFSIVYHMLGI